jgi:diacylglycerol kinase family enzyme
MTLTATMTGRAVPAARVPTGREARPSPGRCFLVINPGSHHGRSRETAARYQALLKADAHGEPITFDSACTKTLEDARVLTRQALAEGYETVVAIGGDGTINRVISALLEPGAGGRRARLGVLYSGTSPDFCCFHGLPTDPVAAVEVLRRGQAHPIDVCSIQHRDANGRPRVDFFASSANIGLGAGIAARANRLRPRCGDFLGTLLASMITIAERGPQRVRLIVDGEELAIAPALNLSVGKNPYLASGLKLDATIAVDDGRMFLFAVCGIGRWQLLASLPRIYSGSIVRDPRFILRRATAVRIEPLDGPLHTEFDGDPAGRCPAEIRVLPGAIQLIGARS